MRRALLTLAILLALPDAVTSQALTFRVNRQPIQLQWETAECPDCTLSHYEVSVDTQPMASVGMALAWTLPILPIGPHVASVRACNTEGECGEAADVSFAIVPAPRPGRPPNATVTPVKP